MTDTLALTLYVAGESAQSAAARRNVESMLDSNADGRDVTLDVVDLHESPAAAVDNNILAIPTLERTAPEPRQRVIGSLDDVDDVWRVLNA